MKDDIEFLRKRVIDLTDEITHYKTEAAYLKGKIDAYEWFLKEQGFIKGGEE